MGPCEESLTDEQIAFNRMMASQMRVGGLYRFSKRVEAVPIERQFVKLRNFMKPVSFREGKYMGFNVDRQAHVFAVAAGCENFFVPLTLFDAGNGLPALELVG